MKTSSTNNTRTVYCGRSVPCVYSALLLLLFLLSSFTTLQAYVTSPGAVPVHRQRAFLQEITIDLCQTTTPLSNEQLSQAPKLLEAWSKQPTAQAAMQSEKLVARVIAEKKAGNGAADLTVRDYNCLLSTWCSLQNNAERCEQIVETMQAVGEPLPNLDSFKLVLKAWRQQRPVDPTYAPFRAQRILDWMIRLYSNGENAQALPDAECFDMCLTIWSRSGHPEAPERTEKLLGAMERLHRSTGAAKPRHTSFNAVLAAWSKSHRPEAADRVMDILSFMELLASHGELTLDAASYNTVMNTVLLTTEAGDASLKAQAILKHALKAQKRDPEHVQLETILFNSAIGALAKSKAPGAFVKARTILDRQITLYENGCTTCRPDVVGYTSVIACCAAETIERTAAFATAMQTFQEIETPNHITYGTMLKACAKLLPHDAPARRKAVRHLMAKAKEAGCVGDMVVSRLREATPELYKELLEGHSKKQLPPEWTRNIDESSKKKGRRAEV
ncbi:hypothetical protein FisN_14Hh335 [Fistulifera solaris]|uniref:Pentacotripeptide-repeat region of PRORP domain-containing protein n=1 Tax=Fistulifera solaris TaxID=1519565 RepID=A0A1Z5KB37_FISSO|nr:hypothetical protein FisN_14Hh335 [Fistulifera solaris]|eukprot:GAX23493.1 hypothetical protein FisN_14Hh335 [Fistulifera solaris]